MLIFSCATAFREISLLPRAPEHTLLFSRFKIVCWKSVIVGRQKYNQTLLLVNNWMISGIQAHSGVAALITQHIRAIMFLFMHYRMKYEGWALFPPWALLDTVTLHGSGRCWQYLKKNINPLIYSQLFWKILKKNYFL